MSELNPPVPESEIRLYLLREMTDAEIDAFEHRMFNDDELFLSVAEYENNLIDRYVASGLSDEDRESFEKSLVAVPERRSRIANARALRMIIEEERFEIAPPSDLPVGGDTSPHPLGSMKVRLVAIAAGILVASAIPTVFLVMDARQKGMELSRVRSENEKMAMEIDALRNGSAVDGNRMDSLRAQFEKENEAVADLTLENESKNLRIQQLEQGDRRGSSSVGASESSNSTVTVIAAKPKETSAKVPARSSIRLVVVRIAVPEDTDLQERATVELNGRTFVRGLPIHMSNGEKFVNVTLRAGELSGRADTIVVMSAKGSRLAERILNKE